MHEEWLTAIEHYCAWLSLAASSRTVALRGYQLGRLAAASAPTGPWQVTAQMLVCFLTAPVWSRETRKSFRAAIVGFYRWAFEECHVDVDPAARLPKVSVRPGKPRPAPEFKVLEAFLRADARGKLMVALAAYAGLRRGEIAAVHSNDIVDGVLYVRGKGDRERTIPLPPQLAAVIRNAGPGYLFPGKIDGHLSADRVGKILGQLLGPGWTPHTLRHRFASQAYAATRDLRAVQELLGHSKPETTAIYTALPDGALRAAVMGAAMRGDAGAA
jgi:integrase